MINGTVDKITTANTKEKERAKENPSSLMEKERANTVKEKPNKEKTKAKEKGSPEATSTPSSTTRITMTIGTILHSFQIQVQMVQSK